MNCTVPSTRSPLYSSTTSPSFIPALAAGLSSSTLFTSTPRSSRSRSAFALSASTSATPMPRKLPCTPRTTILWTFRPGSSTLELLVTVELLSIARAATGRASSPAAQRTRRTKVGLIFLAPFECTSSLLLLLLDVDRSTHAGQSEKGPAAVDLPLGHGQRSLSPRGDLR